MNEENKNTSLLLDEPLDDEEEFASMNCESRFSDSDSFAQMIRDMNEWMTYQTARKWYFRRH